jgi:hypothetical protein
MGVDLCQYGNHKVDFSGRDIKVVAEEIKCKLNSLNLINVDYIKVLMNLWDSSDIMPPAILKVNIKNGIYKEIAKEEWNWEYRIINDEGYQYIKFDGFRDFQLEFSKDKIYFWQPPYRFSGWFYMDSISRNEWRKYMLQIISLFGGDKAIYLPDNMLDSEKYLDEFDAIDSPFEEIENGLISEYGKNTFTLETVTNEDDIYYYIDNFNDLVLENKMSIKEFQDFLWKTEEEEIDKR